MADASYIDNINIVDGSAGNVLSVNTDGSLQTTIISEEEIRKIAEDEAKKALRIKTTELKTELDEETPIRILRRKVQDWLKS